MGSPKRKFGWLLFTALTGALVALGPPAWPQVSVGENTQLNLTGNASFGYNGLFGDTVETNQFVFGGLADLTLSLIHI